MLTVVFATRNRWRILKRTLESFCDLVHPDGGYKVIVVDNGSTDETANVIERYTSQLPLISLGETRPGKNRALNRALELIEGDLTVFTDDDVIVAADWLQQHRQAANEYSDFDIFGGQVLLDWPNDAPFHFTEFKHYDVYWASHEFSSSEAYGNGKMPMGPNFSVRNRYLTERIKFNEDVGPSEGGYIMGSEHEFISRLYKRGYRALKVPQAIVNHQIRPEQLSLEWLEGRAFRAGRWHGFQTKAYQNFPQLFGAPRFLWRMLTESYIKSCATRWQSDKRLWNESLLYFRHLQGWLWQEHCELTDQHTSSLAAFACNTKRFL